MVADKADRPPRTGLSRLASEWGFTAVRDAGDNRFHVGSLPTSRGTPSPTEDQVPQEGQKGSWCFLGFCQVLGSGLSISGKSLSSALDNLLLKQSFSTWAHLTLGLRSSFVLGRDV